jgi:hypothetical protein
LTKSLSLHHPIFLVCTLDLDGEGIKTGYFARVALFLSLLFPNPLFNALSSHSQFSFFEIRFESKARERFPFAFERKYRSIGIF